METDLQSTISDITHRRNIAVLLAVIVVSGLALSIYMYSIDKYALTYYGDAVSHLVAARKLFDWSENPGWNQIGTVWLPLPHFLLMFPSLIDALFFSGFAGLAVSLPSLAGTSILLYKIVTRLLASAHIPSISTSIIPYAAIAAALLYATNPNFLYLGITAMTEAPFMLFFVASAYYLLRWYEEEEQQQQDRKSTRQALKYLIISSIFVIAATLSRYEGWILPLFIIVFAPVLTAIRSTRQARKLQRENETSKAPPPARNTIRPVLYTTLVSLLSLSGIVFWLVYNAVNYGDALEFANAEYYSAASQALNRSFRENLFLQPYNVASVYGLTAFVTFGPIILAAAAIGYYMHRRTAKGDGQPSGGGRYLYIFLALPPIFTVSSMLIGIGEMTFWFNSRFIILLAPLLMLLVGFFLAKQPQKIANNRAFLAGLIAALFVFQLATPAFSSIVTLDDAKGGFTYKHSPYAVLLGEKLGSLYDGSGSIMIMTGSAQEHRIMLASGIPFKNFDSIIESSTWKKSFYKPWKYNNKWIVIAKDPDSDGVSVVKYWADNRSTLEQHYLQIFENEYYEILALR